MLYSVEFTYTNIIIDKSFYSSTKDFDWKNITDVDMTIKPNEFYLNEKEIPINKKSYESMKKYIRWSTDGFKYFVWDKEYLRKVLEEINHIKYRIETMYPVTMTIECVSKFYNEEGETNFKFIENVHNPFHFSIIIRSNEII